MTKHVQSSKKLHQTINIQFKVTFLKHEDSHYTASLFKHLKHFCVQYCDHTFLLLCGDKHNIQMGEPQHAVAAQDRGRRVQRHEGIPIVALDREANITPSVSLVIDIPSSPTETFYRGKVYTHVKDS